MTELQWKRFYRWHILLLKVGVDFWLSITYNKKTLLVWNSATAGPLNFFKDLGVELGWRMGVGLTRPPPHLQK